MAIKDKDGNIYRLRGPNPVMKTQNAWDQKSIKLINFEFQEEIVDDKGQIVAEILQQANVSSNENLIHFKPKTKSQEEIKETPLQVQKIPINSPPSRSENSRTPGDEPVIYNEKDPVSRAKKTYIYCLPILQKQIIDSIYENEYQEDIYGNKITIEAIMLEEDDLFCRFWTNTLIPEKSIVYPRTQTRRWWQVNSLQQEGKGYTIFATPTSKNPDFTD